MKRWRAGGVVRGVTKGGYVWLSQVVQGDCVLGQVGDLTPTGIPIGKIRSLNWLFAALSHRVTKL